MGVMAKTTKKSTRSERRADAPGTPEPRETNVPATSSVVGSLPTEATTWRCFRVTNGEARPCRHPSEDGVEVSEWPLAELNLDVLRARWGSGTYKIQWLGERDGKRVPLGWSKLVTLTSPQPRAATAPAPVASSDLEQYLRLQRMMRQDLQVELERREREHERDLERERIGAQERIAQMQAYWQAMAKQGAPREDTSGLRVQLARLESKLEMERALARRGQTSSHDDEEEDDLIFGMPKELVQETHASLVTRLLAETGSKSSAVMAAEPARAASGPDERKE